MKVKKIIVVILTVIFMVANANYSLSYANPDDKNYCITEEEYIRTISLLLYPYLTKEVQNRYGEYAHVNSYDMDIISITIEKANVSVDIVFSPFKGAHNAISTDKATFFISNKDVEIIKYITIKNWIELKDNLTNIY